jgi:oligoribonuclease (3'-5' exoribonuclease)
VCLFLLVAAHGLSMNAYSPSFTSTQPLHYVWVDLELTGLNTIDDEIVEFGVIGTTIDLDVLFTRTIVVQATGRGLARIRSNPPVLAMHRASGLMNELQNPDASQLTLWEAEAELVNIINSFPRRPDGKVIIAGSGVIHCDRRFMAHHTPALEALFDDREMFDVGHERRAFVAATGVTLSDVNDAKNHRADVDILCHLEEGREFFGLYRSFVGGGRRDGSGTKFVNVYDDLFQMLSSLEALDRDDTAAAEDLAAGLGTARRMHALANMSRLLVNLLSVAEETAPAEVYASVRRSVLKKSFETT